MKLSDKTKQMLADLARTPSKGRIKVDSESVRELAQSDALNRAGVLAATSVLAMLADRTPMAFEDRKHVETVLDSVLNANPNDVESVNNSIKALTQIVAIYHK